MKKTKIDHYTDKEALEFHNSNKSGKIEIVSSKPMTTKRDLALAYSPGVAAPVKEIAKKYWNELTTMCKFEHYPFEKPLHNIYKKELCISPIPSLAVHFTNINSIYGLSPNVEWKRLWDENSS